MALWGTTDSTANKPLYLTSAEKTATAGIDTTEVGVAANKAKGVSHAGWVHTRTYTDSAGQTRNKTEVLVAMSSISGDDNADDTTIGADS